MMLAMTIGPAPDTGSQLGVCYRIIRAVIGFDAGDHTIYYVHPEQAPASTVM